MNAQRVEAIFTRHYREPVAPEEKKEREKRPIRRTHLDPDQLEDLEDALGVKDRQAQAAGVASTPAGHAAAPGAGTEQDTEPAAKEQETTTTRRETRRATRSTGKGLDDWLKIPVSATVKVATGALETLDGIVYVNVENGRKCVCLAVWFQSCFECVLFPRFCLVSVPRILESINTKLNKDTYTKTHKTHKTHTQVSSNNKAASTLRPSGKGVSTSSSSPTRSCP